VVRTTRRRNECPVFFRPREGSHLLAPMLLARADDVIE
jgi:hypothetical protein